MLHNNASWLMTSQDSRSYTVRYQDISLQSTNITFVIIPMFTVCNLKNIWVKFVLKNLSNYVNSIKSKKIIHHHHQIYTAKKDCGHPSSLDLHSALLFNT
jgi:hypothetical protein